MRSIVESLREYVDFNEKKSIFIQGGYFEGDSGIDEFSKNTASLALEMSNYLKGIGCGHSIKLGVLVNDLGMVCGTDVCDITSNKVTDYQVLINEFCERYPQFSGNVKTEKNMKNRGLRKIKKIFKKQLDNDCFIFSKEHDDNIKDWYHRSESDSDILLFQEKHDSWIAKCPTIMGAYYLSCMKEIDSDDESVIIDFCSFSDRDKVLKGAEVALRGFSLGEDFNRKNATIIPVLINDDCSKHVVTCLSMEDF